MLQRISQCVNGYLKNPTYTESNMVPQVNADFPSVTICPEYNGYKEDVLKVGKWNLLVTKQDWHNNIMRR